MAKKGVLVGVIVVLAVIVLSFVIYFVVLPSISQNSPSSGSLANNQSVTAPDFNGNITTASFQTFPAGTQIAPGMIGTVTNIFHKGDQFGVNGTSNVDRQVTLTIKVFDANGNDLGAAYRWHGDTIKIQSGAFGFGVMGAPMTAGNYVLKIYLDNYESYDMPFQVV